MVDARIALAERQSRCVVHTSRSCRGHRRVGYGLAGRVLRPGPLDALPLSRAGARRRCGVRRRQDPHLRWLQNRQERCHF